MERCLDLDFNDRARGLPRWPADKSSRTVSRFYLAATTGMTIKDPQVHAVAREWAARRDTRLGEAVR